MRRRTAPDSGGDRLDELNASLNCVNPVPHSTTPGQHATAIAALAIIAAVGCTTPDDGARRTPGPRLALVDSIALDDTGAFALGDLAHAGLHMGDDAFWIGDPQNGRVVRFARDGRLLGQVGRKGPGPGEIAATGPLVALAERSLPSLAFRGDTLFTLEHAITGERSVPLLRAFVISSDRCAWTPVERR